MSKASDTDRGRRWGWWFETYETDPAVRPDMRNGTNVLAFRLAGCAAGQPAPPEIPH